MGTRPVTSNDLIGRNSSSVSRHNSRPSFHPLRAVIFSLSSFFPSLYLFVNRVAVEGGSCPTTQSHIGRWRFYFYSRPDSVFYPWLINRIGILESEVVTLTSMLYMRPLEIANLRSRILGSFDLFLDMDHFRLARCRNPQNSAALLSGSEVKSGSLQTGCPFRIPGLFRIHLKVSDLGPVAKDNSTSHRFR